MRLGPFVLVDPPPDGDDLVRSVLNACIYPWARILPTVREVPVRWVPTPQRTDGLYIDEEIHLGYGADAFTFAHELGHLVDQTTLLAAERRSLIELLHTSNPTVGHLNHDHPDVDHPEKWNVEAEHPASIHEAFADAFVAAFCPTIWEGHYVRFVHWPADLDAFRGLVLARDIPAFADIATSPHRPGIEKAAVAGIVGGKGDGLFHPDDAVSRAQICTILDRAGVL